MRTTLLFALTVALVIAPAAFCADVALKWYVDTSVHTGMSKTYSSSTLPVAANVDGDPQLEIFYGGGTDAGSGQPHPGFVISLDGKTGALEWVDTCNGFGRHTVIELGDVDLDGKLELVACGMNRVAVYEAESGVLKWDYWNDPDHENPTTTGRKDKHPLLLKEPDGIVYIYVSGNGQTSPVIKFRGTDGEIMESEPVACHTCHGGFSGWDLDNDGTVEIFNSDRGISSGGSCNGLMELDPSLTILHEWNSIACSSHCPTIIDVDEDGVLDIVIADQGGGGIAIVDGETKGPMAGKWQESIPGFGAHDNNNIYDIDGDGNLELISGDNNKASGADVFDLGDWQLESYSPLWAAPGVGYAHPLAIGNVWQDGNGNEMELIGFTSEPSVRGWVVIYQWNPGTQDFDIKQDLRVYLNQMIVQDIDNDGLNEIIGMGTKGIDGSNCRGTIQVFDTDGVNTGYRTWNQWYSERRTGAPGDLGESLAPLEVVVDPTPVVDLTWPLDERSMTDTTPIFFFKVSDPDDASVDCTLYVDGTEKGSGSATSDGTTTNTITSSPLSYSTHTWHIECTDGENTGISTSWSITIYQEPPPSSAPSVNLVSPVDWENTTDTTPIFAYIVSDDDNTTNNCTLYIDGSIVSGDHNAVADGNTTNTLTTPKMPYGTHTWNVECTDETNSSVSPTWSIIIHEEVTLPTIPENTTEPTPPPPTPPPVEPPPSIPPETPPETPYTPPITQNTTENQSTGPTCGNGLKEEGEHCDGNDGVPEGYQCTSDCKLTIQAGTAPETLGEETRAEEPIDITMLIIAILAIATALAAWKLYTKLKKRS